MAKYPGPTEDRNFDGLVEHPPPPYGQQQLLLAQDAHARERTIRDAASDAAVTLERFAASQRPITPGMVLAVATKLRHEAHEE